jgi:hypothetical protein
MATGYAAPIQRTERIPVKPTATKRVYAESHNRTADPDRLAAAFSVAVADLRIDTDARTRTLTPAPARTGAAEAERQHALQEGLDHA